MSDLNSQVELRKHAFDVVVIGAGPGGIAAAVTASEQGQTVALVDDNPNAGGQIWRNRDGKSKIPQAAHWLARLASAKGVTRFQQTRIVAPLPGKRLLAESGKGPLELTYGSLILATGSRELFLPFPGWTLQGVLGAGAIQALVKSGFDVSGKRIVVAGTGPLLLAVADLLRSCGATVPVIVEQATSFRINTFGLSLLSTPSKLLAGIALRARLLGTTYATDAYPTRVVREGSSLKVSYRRHGRDQTVNCDLLACGFNLIPSDELPLAMGCRLSDNGFVETQVNQLTSVPDVYAVGELTGVGGADKALIEGEIAALATKGNTGRIATLASAHQHALAFTDRLAKAFALRPELKKLADAETIVCRCEDVKLGEVSGCHSSRDAKLQTRCGMGPCQGRICGPVLTHVCGFEHKGVRPPILASSIATLAAAKPAEK